MAALFSIAQLKSKIGALADSHSLFPKRELT
jgi:hypothetical protein